MPLYRRPGSENWWLRLSIAGTRYRGSTGTTDRGEAEAFEEKERSRLYELHKLGNRGAILWEEVSSRYLNDSQRARKRDREILKWLGGELDGCTVAQIDSDAVEELRKSLLAEDMMHSTVDRFMHTLRAVLRKCVEWEILKAVPKVPMYNMASAEPQWLTQTQFARLKKELPPHLAVAAEFAVRTGLRMRSQSMLTWDRIDLKERRLRIPGKQMKAGRAHGIPLSTAAIKVLRQAKSLSPKGDAVFQYEGVQIDNFNTKAFKKAAVRAGIAVIPDPDDPSAPPTSALRWHDLRHTFAAWAVQGGVTLHELMGLGGWASYQSVLIYAHLAPDHLAAAAEKVGTKRAQ